MASCQQSQGENLSLLTPSLVPAISQHARLPLVSTWLVSAWGDISWILAQQAHPQPSICCPTTAACSQHKEA